MDIVTQQGQPASILGLAGNPKMDLSCVPIAYAAGINYFFFYDLSNDHLLDGIKRLTERENILVATGSETRTIRELNQYLDKVRRRLDIDVVDAFFIEYVSPSDDLNLVQAILDELYVWKEQGRIRYVGASTHNRQSALELIKARKCDVLMHRYNMAHRQAEETLLPAALQAKIPVVAFTCTRWGSLLSGHPDWHKSVPSAADCYRYALRNSAVRIALTAPQTLAQLQQNLAVLSTPQLTDQEDTIWREYGDVIYGIGQDSFETQWS